MKPKDPNHTKSKSTTRSTKTKKGPHNPQVTTPEYLFESFLPYREALNLERALYGLCKLKKILLQGRDVEEQIIERVSFNIRYLLPNVKPANLTKSEFENTLKKEKEEKSLSEEEIKEKIERESEELRKKIDSGEIDIWDDTPHFIEVSKCQEYLNEALNALKSKIIDHLAPEKSFLEKMVKEGYSILSEPDCQSNLQPNPQTKTDSKYLVNPKITKLQALLRVWDYGKIAYEKEPPYKIVFSEQVAELLGIDPVMESIKLQELRSLTKREKKELKRLNSIVWGGKIPTKSMSKAIESPKSIPWASAQEICAIHTMAQRKNAKDKNQPFEEKEL